MGFRSKFERFCLKHDRWGIPNLMRYIVLLRALVYLLGYMNIKQPYLLYSWLSFDPALILRGQVWRILTFTIAAFPGERIFLTAISLLFYYFIGTTLESSFGKLKFNIYYFSGVLLTAAFGLIFNCAADSSYLNLSMFMALATLAPDTQVRLYFIIPIKMKWLGYFYMALTVFQVATGFASFPANLLPLVALLNYFFYFWPYFLDFFRRKKYRYSPNVINFRKEKRKAERAKKQAGSDFTHKCAVCGRTDRSNPELEFRYCSRCDGYYCYCQDHINSHVHVKNEQ